MVRFGIDRRYWTLDKSTKNRFPLTRSTYRAFRYSFGSVLVGSLLITVVEIIRLFLYKVQRQVSKSQVLFINNL